MTRAEFARRAHAVLQRRHADLPPQEACAFEFAEPDPFVTVSAGGRVVGRCQLVYSVKGARVRAIPERQFDKHNTSDYTQSPSALAKQGDTTTATHNHKTMKLRFNVNQAECFRRGINHTTSTATLEVDPSKLDQPTRDLIAPRLNGIDVVHLKAGYAQSDLESFIEATPKAGAQKRGLWQTLANGTPHRIEALTPTFDSLLEAIKEDQARLEAELAKE